MAESEIKVSQELVEKRVPITRENVKYQGGGGGAVNSVNGQTGDVVLTAEDVGALPDTTEIPTNVSELTNDAGYQTASEVASAVAGEATLRQSADNNLQSQIDAISASSDVTDIVGTYAELQSYDTSTLGDKDIIKVLQDESRNDETTYYRWSTTTQTFTLIGEEGPYYTKSQADGRFVAQTTYTTDKAALEDEIDTKQDELTAGNNIQISGSVISATDTTYSDFTGTDGQTAGTAGLVPAPATTDADKYLKSDGTWDTVAAGPTVVQTTGTSTTDVMSQDATTKMIYPRVEDSSQGRRAHIMIGSELSNAEIDNSSYNTFVGVGTGFSAQGSRSQAVALGYQARVGGNNAIAMGFQAVAGVDSVGIGQAANASGASSIAIGRGANGAGTGLTQSVAIGTFSSISRTREVSIGNPSYAQAPTRFLANVTDPALPQDAATKNYVDNVVISFAAISGATAPTTATEGKYIGQLYYDTTNDTMYYLSSIDDTQTPVEYNWSTFGGGGPTVVQTTGTSTTDVMSQNATTRMVHGNTSWASVKIGPEYGKNYLSSRTSIIILPSDNNFNSTSSIVLGGSAMGQNGVTSIGLNSMAVGTGTSIGFNAKTLSGYSIAIGDNAEVPANISKSVALGYNARTSRVGEVNIGAGTTTDGYNSTSYRVLGGVHAAVDTHDAVNLEQMNARILAGGTAAPTTATVGEVGTLYAYVESGTGHLAICTASDASTSTYTWAILL